MSPAWRPAAAVAVVGLALLAGAGFLPRAGEEPGGSPPAFTPSERGRAGLPVDHVVSTVLRGGEGADDAPSERTVVQRFHAEARPIDGLLGWPADIVLRSARGVLSQGGELYFTGKAEVLLYPDRLEARSGWYRWAIPWREVKSIYAVDTNYDTVELCVKPYDGELIILSDIDLGPAAYDVAAAGTEELVRLGRWE